MNPATMLTISAEQTKDMRQQAAAQRRALEARGAVRARSASAFALIARNVRSLTGRKRQGAAAA